MKKTSNPIAAYTIASHIAFVVATPLLVFIWGGTRLAEHFGFPEWTKILFILFGIAVMVSSLINYLRRLIAQYSDVKRGDFGAPPSPKFKNENDYYYENNTKPHKPDEKRRSGANRN